MLRFTEVCDHKSRLEGINGIGGCIGAIRGEIFDGPGCAVSDEGGYQG